MGNKGEQKRGIVLWLEMAIVKTKDYMDKFMQLLNKVSPCDEVFWSIELLKKYCYQVTVLIDYHEKRDYFLFSEKCGDVNKTRNIVMFNIGLRDCEDEEIFCVVKKPCYNSDGQEKENLPPEYHENMKRKDSDPKLQNCESSLIGFYTLKEIEKKTVELDSLNPNDLELLNKIVGQIRSSKESTYIGDYVIDDLWDSVEKKRVKSLSECKIKLNNHTISESFDNFPRKLFDSIVIDTLKLAGVDKWHKSDDAYVLLVKKILSQLGSEENILKTLKNNLESLIKKYIDYTKYLLGDDFKTVMCPHYYEKANKVQYAFPLYLETVSQPSCVLVLEFVEPESTSNLNLRSQTVLTFDEYLTDFRVLGGKDKLSSWLNPPKKTNKYAK